MVIGMANGKRVRTQSEWPDAGGVNRMLDGKHVIVVLSGYRTAMMLERTCKG